MFLDDERRRAGRECIAACREYPRGSSFGHRCEAGWNRDVLKPLAGPADTSDESVRCGPGHGERAKLISLFVGNRNCDFLVELDCLTYRLSDNRLNIGDGEALRPCGKTQEKQDRESCEDLELLGRKVTLHDRSNIIQTYFRVKVF